MLARVRSLLWNEYQSTSRNMVELPEWPIRSIKEAVTIPVMAKGRIGHFVEAQILDIEYIDESEALRWCLDID